jgi:tyrosyl-DNA phosphodiesterase 2
MAENYLHKQYLTNKKDYSTTYWLTGGQKNGEFIYNTKKSIPYDREHFDLLELQTKKDFPYYCPDENPYLCTVGSKSLGLCKKTGSDCDDPERLGTQPIIALPYTNESDQNEGERFGYSTNRLHLNCNTFNKIYEYSDDTIKKLSVKKIKLMTFNIMGIIREKEKENIDKYNFKLETMKMRIRAVADEIMEHTPDIICFQEMSNTAYKLLTDHIGSHYPHIYEKDYNIDEKTAKERGHDIEVCVFSKYPASHVKLYSLDGLLDYTCSLMVVEFGKSLAVYNCYLQAGSKKSAGQQNYWFHYARCRMDQLRIIRKMIQKKKKPTIVTGDFNQHLDGPVEDWPELQELDFLKDAWKILRPDENGLTEDTSINHMRWNMKFQEKKLRYDGILYRGDIKPMDIMVICKKPIPLNEQMSGLFEKYWMKTNNDTEKIKYYDPKRKILSIFPSDHFGVICEFALEKDKQNIIPRKKRDRATTKK